jgi:putative DNA methylase
MTTQKTVAPKKLIEVALPLDDINKACVREKSIRHGHPSTLHLWWARRPLAAARAVIFAQLVNDPSWKYSADEIKKPQIRSAITRKRNELFRLISELVQWENTANEQVLARARAEIRASWRETCEANRDHPNAKTLFDPERLPAFHDPFAGGGAIPFEAQRLGLEAHASDLNPVAVLINKAMIELPPRFVGRAPVGPIPSERSQESAQVTEQWPGVSGLAEDVRRYGAWIRAEAERRLGKLYPKLKITKEMVKERPDLKAYENRELTVIAYLWARTVKSPNPAFAEIEVPLVSTYLMSAKVGKEAWIEPIVDKKGYRFSVHAGTKTRKAPASAKNGTKLARANFACLMSGSPIPGDYIKAEGQAGRMGARMMAVIAEGDRDRVYIEPTPSMEAAARQAKPTWRPTGDVPAKLSGGTCVPYGLREWGDLFTPRQLFALTTFADLVRETRTKVIEDAKAAGMKEAEAYANAVAVYLGFAASSLSDRMSTLCTWDAGGPTWGTKTRNTFARQAIPMSWDFAEVNPLSTQSGSFENSLDYTSKGVVLGGSIAGNASQLDAMTQTESALKIVSTDPPYYNNIYYADLSDFFYVWLRRALGNSFPDLFATLAVPKAEELVATAFRHGGKEEADAFFLQGMTLAIHQLASQSHPASPVTIYYAFKQSETEEAGTGSTGWETFLEAVLKAGFAVVGTWPMRTELANRMIGSGTNALASSIVLVCRARVGASTVARKDFLRELDRALPVAITEMTADPSASIAPVDLAQACIGPGMAIFSTHEAVLEADGSPMSVHNALVHINKAIDDFFSAAEGDLDADTRFCIGWFQQHGVDVGAFGEADVLARAKGTSVDGVREAGVLDANKGKVRLYKIAEMPKAWDPTTDKRVPVWEACHQLCRALGDSEGDAGALLAKMPEKEEAVRLLAYRLYTLCERKGWADQARAYNELITSWPAIVEASRSAGIVGTQMELI